MYIKNNKEKKRDNSFRQVVVTGKEELKQEKNVVRYSMILRMRGSDKKCFLNICPRYNIWEKGLFVKK
jgi:hypothetical protein